MDNVSGGNEESKVNLDQGQQNQQSQQRSEQDIVTELTQILDNLFYTENIVKNSYLVNRASDVSFEIPVKCIYDEHTIRSRCGDEKLINQALLAAKNLVATKKDDKIISVRPSKTSLKTIVRLSQVQQKDSEDLRQFVGTLVNSPENDFEYEYNSQRGVVTIFAATEAIAAEIFNKIQGTQFKESKVVCNLDSETLYTHALETTKKLKRQNPYKQQYYNNYQMPYYNPNNFGFMNMNPYFQGPEMYRYDNYSYKGRGGGGGKYYNKRGGGGGNRYYSDKRSYGQNRQDNGQSNNNQIQFDEDNFPSLKNEGGEEQN